MASFGINLVLNPGAEEGGPTPIPNWTTTGTFTEFPYGGNADSSATGGNQLFEGGNGSEQSSAFQDIALGDLSPFINAGQVTANISGELGGYQNQNDFMTLSVTWLDSNNNSLGTVNTPNVSAADRGNQSILLPVSMNGAVPAGTVTARITMTATRTDGNFNNGYADNISLVLQQAPCFATGTRILTARGQVTVADLVVGDLAVTTSGAERSIRWIGHRTIDCSNCGEPRDIMPVRIAAGALGDNRPTQDLVVSPGHSLCLDLLGEVLIPASALVNGSTITQETVDTVTYWHVELDSHDILIAEGQPAESYLDMGNRGFFAEAAVVDLGATPDAAARTHADFCRPYFAEGALVDTVRGQLRRRAETLGWRVVQHEPWVGVHLEIDGRIVEPKTRGLSACFELPAGVADVVLVSPTGVPMHVWDLNDSRALGLPLKSLRLDDGLGEARAVALDDPLLDAGFHGLSHDHRWTAGRALLPAALFAGLAGTAFLRVELSMAPVPQLIAPTAVVDETASDAPRLTLAA